MHPKRKKKLYIYIGLLALLSCFVGLILFGLGQNINHFYQPSQLLDSVPSKDQRIRVGGMVKKGSVIKQSVNGLLQVTFDITDYKAEVQVRYNGLLPDLFREGQGIVVTGFYNGNIVLAEQVLAKHDENYMPPELTPLQKTSDTKQLK